MPRKPDIWFARETIRILRARHDELFGRQGACRRKQQLIENWIALELASGAYLPMANSPATTQSLK